MSPDSSFESTISGGPDRDPEKKGLEAGSQLRYFGDFEILEEIARGGMGIVYRARQVTLDRLVALKVILGGDFASEGSVRRFRREAEAAAQLDHPNIVPIYEVGEHDGTHYFTMKLIDGKSLRERPDEMGREQNGAATIIMKTARAVDYAHRRGVVHRDLKPANVLIDSQGEPQVADFGLARRFGNEPSLTKSDAIVGTPSYMAPEQAAGGRVLTTAVDIYALGALLYDLLAGRPPFRGESIIDTLRQVLQDEPAKLSSLRRDVDRDLEAIVLHCLEKEPERRYRTAGELADDLELFLQGKPIHARPITWLWRSYKWVRRYRQAVAVTALLLALAGLAGGLELAQRQSADRRQRERIKEVLDQSIARNVSPSFVDSYWPAFEADVAKRLARHNDEELRLLVRRASIQVVPDVSMFGLTSEPPHLYTSFSCVSGLPPLFAWAELQGSFDGGSWIPLYGATFSTGLAFGTMTNLAESFGPRSESDGPHRLALRAAIETFDPESVANKGTAMARKGGGRSNWPELHQAKMIGREIRDLGEHRLHLFDEYPSSFPERVAVYPSLGSAFRLDRVQLAVLEIRAEDPPCFQVEWESQGGTLGRTACLPGETRPGQRLLVEALLQGSFDLSSRVALAGTASLRLDERGGNMVFDFAMGGGRYFIGRRESFAGSSTGSFGVVRLTALSYQPDTILTASAPTGSYDAEFRLEPSREVALATSRIDRFFDRPVATRTRVEIVPVRRVRADAD